MQLGAQPLRRGAIDRLLDEHVPEAEHAIRAAAARSRASASVRRCASAVGAASGSSSATTSSERELLPDDRAALEHRALAGAEPVEARGEQRLDRLRQRALGEAAFQREREELLEEERVALGGLDDAGALIRLEDRPAETVEQRVGLLRGERVEHDPVDVRAPLEERGPLLEELLAREADDRDRPLALVREVLDELEEGRLGPVDVVEDEDERLLARAVASQNRRKSQAISGAGGGVSASSAARTASRSSLAPAPARAPRAAAST